MSYCYDNAFSATITMLCISRFHSARTMTLDALGANRLQELLKQGPHHNGDQAARRPHMIGCLTITTMAISYTLARWLHHTSCSIWVHSFGVLQEAVRFITSQPAHVVSNVLCSLDIFLIFNRLSAIWDGTLNCGEYVFAHKILWRHLNSCCCSSARKGYFAEYCTL